MPIYAYECRVCRHRFELRQGFDAAPEATCPRCSGLARRCISQVAVIFKGSGWYVTDYGARDRGGTSRDGGSSSEEGKDATSASREGREKE